MGETLPPGSTFPHVLGHTRIGTSWAILEMPLVYPFWKGSHSGLHRGAPEVQGHLYLPFAHEKRRQKSSGQKFGAAKKAPGVPVPNNVGDEDAVRTSLREVWPRLPPPVPSPNTDLNVDANTRAATIQGEHNAQIFGRPPERGGGH